MVGCAYWPSASADGLSVVPGMDRCDKQIVEAAHSSASYVDRALADICM